MRPLQLTLLGALLAACGDKADDTGSVGGINVSWEGVYDEVLAPSCAYSTCHSGSGNAGLGWDDADGAYDALVDADAQQIAGMKRVVPGDADASYLMWKLDGRDGIEGEAMPPGGALDARRTAMVEGWIAHGARRD